MKKIISLLLILIIFLSGCSKNDEGAKPLSSDSIAGQLSFDFEEDATESYLQALTLLTQYGISSKLTALSPQDETISLFNHVSGETNPYEELIYTCNDTRREISWRYMCFDDLNKFDTKYVKEQMKILFGINLDNNDFEHIINQTKESINNLNKDEIFPVRILNDYNVSVIVGATNNNGQLVLTIKATYGVYRVDIG